MIRNVKNIIWILFLASIIICGQENVSKLKIVGDSLKGKVVDGRSIREVIGNVVITQDDVTITCNKAIQFIDANNAELIGNVIIVQDSVIIKTERGKYFGTSRIAMSDSSVHLNNRKMDLSADRGNYNLETKIANFFGNVNFKDSVTNLNSQKLIYKKEIEEIIAVGSVVVSDTASNIKADSLIHFRTTRFSEGFGNVIVESNENNLTIFGDTLVDNKLQNTTRILGDPFLTQIEELNNGNFDTLFIKSKVLESRNDSTESLYAVDSVQIIRGGFLSNNDFTIYDRTKEQIKIFKQENKSTPVLWYENNQIIGDSIYINLDSSKIKNVDIVKNAILISQDSTFKFRFNQMSGDTINLGFKNSKLSQTKVFGNVLSIYYMFEEEEPNGLLKSSAQQIVINFENSKVSEVKLFGSPISEYHPENLVVNNEKSFTLPSFFLYANKPDKHEFKSIFLRNKLK
jgi:lipopolysaccharide export system protein LptA